jgi:hypothetical protein
MKFIVKISCWLLFSVLVACSNDIEINAPYQDIAVVYSFLDQNEPVQYIRIEKVYQNNASLSTAEGAKLSDSLYFDSLEVSLTNVNTKSIYPCTKVDTIPKQELLIQLESSATASISYMLVKFLETQIKKKMMYTSC